jgi:hypothetical protein
VVLCEHAVALAVQRDALSDHHGGSEVGASEAASNAAALPPKQSHASESLREEDGSSLAEAGAQANSKDTSVEAYGAAQTTTMVTAAAPIS